MVAEAARLASAKLEADGFRTTIEDLLAGPTDIPFADVVKLASWLELYDAADAPKKAVASEFQRRLLDAFRAQKTISGGRPPKIGIFSRAGGVCVLPDGGFGIVMVTSAIKFDASLGLALLERINRVAEEAQEWWPVEGGRASGELARHHERAYGLATFTIGAIDLENASHVHRTAHDPAPLAASQVVPPGQGAAPGQVPAVGHGPASGEVPSPGPRFRNEMAIHEPRVAHVEGLLREATERTAQTRYGLGMAWGTLVLAAVTACIAGAAGLVDVSEGFAIGFAAGGLGAVVSVLQRMTKGGLKLVGRDRQLLRFGGLRPLVGGLFGALVVTLMQAGLLNVHATGHASQLALYGSLAFFAGFNERFAQDALALSGSVLVARANLPSDLEGTKPA